LSEWVARYPGDFGDRTWEADKAIRAVGTNGIPYLLKCLRYETPIWRRKLNTIIAKVRPSWQAACQGEVRANNAEQAFIALGQDGVVAVPELWNLAHEPGESPRNSTKISNFSFGLYTTGRGLRARRVLDRLGAGTDNFAYYEATSAETAMRALRLPPPARDPNVIFRILQSNLVEELDSPAIGGVVP